MNIVNVELREAFNILATTQKQIADLMHYVKEETDDTYIDEELELQINNWFHTYYLPELESTFLDYNWYYLAKINSILIYLKINDTYNFDLINIDDIV